MIVQWLVGAVSIVFMFLLLVTPHEFGHFIFSKLFKVRVIEFAVGLGQTLWSTTRGGTLYALRAIPVGGYNRLGGMEPGDYADPQGFHGKPAYQRILILLGGPLANFLLAALIMTGVYLTQVNTDPGKVVGVFKDSPAYAQGVRPGDSIRSVDGTVVGRPEDIRNAESAKPGQPLSFVVRHPNGQQFTAIIQPAYDSQYKRYLIGIQSEALVTPVDAIRNGVEFPVVATYLIGSGMYELATGQIPGGLFGPQGATGPIGIGYITYQAAAAGLVNYAGIVALLSMALGLANLLPLPALDGGRILVVLAEKLRGKPFDREREMAVQRAGLVALLGLMALIAFFDVQRIVTGQFGVPH